MEPANGRESPACEVDADTEAGCERPQMVSPNLSNTAKRNSVQSNNAPIDAHDGTQRPATSKVFGTKEERWEIEDDCDNDQGKNRPSNTELFVQELLPSQKFDEEGLRQHLCRENLSRSFIKLALGIKWPPFDNKSPPADATDGDVTNASKSNEMRRPLFPKGEMIPRIPSKGDRSHCQIIEVGADGLTYPSPEDIRSRGSVHEWPYVWGPQQMAVWEALRSIPFVRSQAAGRMTIVNQLSPALMAALHYVMFNAIPIDDLFIDLCFRSQSFTNMNMTMRNLGQEHGLFAICLRYMTLIEQEHECFDWQESSPQDCSILEGIRISACLSHISLAIRGKCMRKFDPLTHRAWEVYDIFAPWQVLNFRCCPREPNAAKWCFPEALIFGCRRIGCGPEAFMIALRDEYFEAFKRLNGVYRAVSQSMTNSKAFIFNPELIDKYLDVADGHAFAKRCLWASAILDSLTRYIEEMIDVYTETFTDDVWEGRHETIWPLQDQSTLQSVHYRKRMARIRSEIEGKLRDLKNLSAMVSKLQKDIMIREARRSALAADAAATAGNVAVQQGRNIRILTTVSIFFLPLTYVTSVFGMTNMDPNESFWKFGVVTTTICVPFFILMASLNSKRGFAFWERNFKAVLQKIKNSWSRLWMVFGGSGESREAEMGLRATSKETGVPEEEPEAVLGAAREDTAQSQADRKIHGVRSRLFGLRSRFKRDTGAEQML